MRELKIGLFLLPPVLSVLVFWPIWLSMLGALVHEPQSEYFFARLLLFLVGLVVIVCAPGYVYLLFVDIKNTNISVAKKWWITLSLFMAFSVSLLGVIASAVFLLTLLFPPALASLGTVSYLYYKFNRQLALSPVFRASSPAP